MDKKCEWCGTMMYGVYPTKKFCSQSCSAKAYRYRKANNISSTHKVCLKCNKEFDVDPKASARKYCYECMPKNSYHNGASRRALIKKWALDYKGNSCEICGYNKCTDALEFHHRDSLTKDFTIGGDSITFDWELIKQELNKCQLLCANCHREEHARLKEKEGKE